MKKNKSPEGGWLRITAAIIGALIAAVLISMLLAIYLPMPTNNRLALSGILVVPIWVGLSFVCILSKSGWRAWGYCLTISALSIYPVFIGITGKS